MSDHDNRNMGKIPDEGGVEVVISAEGVVVRHSREPEEVLHFTPDEWTLFLKGVKSGEFD